MGQAILRYNNASTPSPNAYNGFENVGAADMPYMGGPMDGIDMASNATGNLAARHGENTDYFSGTKSKASAGASYIEKQTVRAYKKIKAAATSADTTPEDIALKFLKTKLDALERYIRSKGEVPSTNNDGIIVQACLLRMQDINVISSAANLSEDDALKEIQAAESEAILNSTADKDNVLDPDTQAALNCLIVVLLTKMEAATGAGDIRSAMNLIKVNSVTPLNNFNNALGDTPLTPLDLSLTPATTTDTSGQSSSSFFDILNKIAATAATVSSSIKDVSGAVSGATLQVSNAVQTVGANTGASAISLYMQRNGLTILIIGLLAIVLLIILTRAAKN